MTIILLILTVPGLVCLYAFVLRPLLHKLTGLQAFYTQSDGFWAKVWAASGKSITMLWGYILAAVGSAMQLLDPLASALGDPQFKDQVTNALGANPKALGWFAIAVSFITIAARLRGLAKG